MPEPTTTAPPTTVTLMIDGKSVTVPPGTLLIEAAKQNGIDIPSFCYYPGLSLQGACRMCVVTIEKMPKLQTACTTVVGNGMVVHTDNEEVKNARKAMLEFLLTNHPLDCPVCDKGGECELQDMVFTYGAAETRFLDTKYHEEEKKFSNLVYYDRPRCILCYRCIRVCDEGMDVNAYGIGFRGAHSEIIPNHGDKLECEECGACIDICPVGALTSGPYRYKTRPWELTYTGTICNHCGDGCKTTLSIRNNGIIRANNRDHSGINGEFLCVKGRFGWDFVNNEDRVTAPRIRRDGKQEESTWEEALGTTVARLNDVIARHGANSVAVIGSNRTTNEENYLLSRFARTVLGTNNVDHHRTADYSSLVAALTQSRATGRYATMQDVAAASSILLIGNNPTPQHPLLAYQIRQAVRQHGARLYIVNSADIKLRRQANLYVQVNPAGEARAVRVLIGTEPASAGRVDAGSASISELADKLKAESDTVVIFGDEIHGEAIGDLVRWGLTLPGCTRFIALGDYANSRGAADMGLLPGNLPGYGSINDADAREHFEKLWGTKLPAQPGHDLRGILDGIQTREIKALLVFGSNPVKTFKLEQGALRALEFLAVVDLFSTETAEDANVFFPATSFAEKPGTITNTCGQLQAVKRTMRKPGTRSDLEIIVALARQFGHPWPYQSPDDVLKEIIASVRGYSIALPTLLLGGAVVTSPEGNPPALEREDLIFSSRDSLFTSGTVSRFSPALNSVEESKRPHDHIF
jgi:NADH-quinone oxidoreductase subunit G